MGNSPTSTTGSHLLSPTPRHASVSSRSRLSSFTKGSGSNSIYNEILKDAEKLRQSDRKANYNPHRRIESIASNLPTQLQNYSNTIHTVNEFWLNSIQTLPETELNELVTVCYCRLYLQCKTVRDILLFTHGRKVFNVFGYVIRNLVDPSNHIKLFRQLQMLGNMHSSYSLQNETYELFLDAFNFAMEEKFKKDYKIRTRFCFGQLYRVIVDIMTGDDFYSVTTRLIQNNAENKALSPILRLKRFSSAHKENKKELQSIQPIHGVDTSSSSNINDDEFDDDELNRLQSPRKKKKSFNYTQIDSFLGSLEECLSDEKGSLYFKKYLEEQFCVENFLFHEFVLKYKASKSAQRIKVGQLIIDEFVQIGSEKEVNLSYNTRKQILTIVNLVKKMNENKEKYQQIYNKNKMSMIINEDDIKYLNNENENRHYRMATTKKLPIELFEITNLQNEDIPDLIYSMGYTANLFDKAYDEIFNLMRINFWSNFRNTILEFVDNDDFVKMQKAKYSKKKEEQRNMGGMIQVINSIQKTYTNNNNNKNKNNNNNDMKSNPDVNTLRNMLSRVDSIKSPVAIITNGHTNFNYNSRSSRNGKTDTYSQKQNDNSHDNYTHKRRKSQDDFDVNYIYNMKSKSSTVLTLNSQFGSKLSLILDDKETKDRDHSDSDNESDNKQSDSDIDSDLDEHTENTMKRKILNRRITPRLSFIPSLMPSIEKSTTSPTVKQSSNTDGFDTPNGGAAITPEIDKNSKNSRIIQIKNAYHKNNGSYSPSELFNLVSSTIPWDYSNKVNDNKNSKRKSTLHKTKSKRKSTHNYNKQLPYNKKLPLYATHKKRKSKLAKRNSILKQQPINALTQSVNSV